MIGEFIPAPSGPFRRTGRTTRMVFEILACRDPDVHVIAAELHEALRIRGLVQRAAESVGWSVSADGPQGLRIEGRRVTFGVGPTWRGRRCSVFEDHGRSWRMPKA